MWTMAESSYDKPCPPSPLQNVRYNNQCGIPYVDTGSRFCDSYLGSFVINTASLNLCLNPCFIVSRLLITDPRWRAPDLQEVIEYLGHQDEAIAANAAAYLQHLTYGDDAMKNKTR